MLRVRRTKGGTGKGTVKSLDIRIAAEVNYSEHLTKWKEKVG